MRFGLFIIQVIFIALSGVREHFANTNETSVRILFLYIFIIFFLPSLLGEYSVWIVHEFIAMCKSVQYAICNANCYRVVHLGFVHK